MLSLDEVHKVDMLHAESTHTWYICPKYVTDLGKFLHNSFHLQIQIEINSDLPKATSCTNDYLLYKIGLDVISIRTYIYFVEIFVGCDL
jgi:hypothetical protein